METGEKMKVGIVGCGYQGGRLASAIRLTGSLVVTACMDIDSDAADKLAGSLVAQPSTPRLRTCWRSPASTW